LLAKANFDARYSFTTVGTSRVELVYWLRQSRLRYLWEQRESTPQFEDR